MEPKRIGKYISITYRYAMSYFKQEMAVHDLHPSHHMVLFSLYKKDGISQEKLSRELTVDKATVTRSIKKLVEDGFIDRRQDKDDKRLYHLHLTNKSMNIRPEIEFIFKNWNNILLDGLSEEEVDQAIYLLKKISSNATKYHDGDISDLNCMCNEVKNNE